MQNFLDFEKPLLEIRTKIEELRHLKDTSENIANELTVLQDKFDKKLDLTRFLQVTFHLFMKNTFSIWSHLRHVLKELAVLKRELSLSLAILKYP